ncbi:EVE domain-containing protein [Schinkia azotoformans]|uniref:UPF0310 protein BAZO_12514 n=1 Tax=Schinkia azotoformans LMG 9581 TaxID=1131731 RepID=K6D9P3_SCHAZ|nr:EVE domain-containing protein [Schinkia azotoformans]EKN64813.1 hypothetical protein BAZO_12514 [Schinkia azotoformans LMG 9581]MEC1640086.1 EVE domain-containing protein [Schinkia azotoformans]MEC1722597.1 EVE domain-containing protein [Schinkia azotoformans]MEC1943524.1 EVE domain-containing protein [Schinkia azotoformans]MED4415448.1 EVE domain-containing protein [Schinkia azotoformans]
MNKYWIGVASDDHVKHGVLGGFCQLCHGKSSPLKRMKKGDWIIYYSPKNSLSTKIPCQKFTAIGEILDSNIYQVEMYPGFQPFRMNVKFLKSITPVPLNLVSSLPLWQDYRSRLRFGHFEIPKELFMIISDLMNLKN